MNRGVKTIRIHNAYPVNISYHIIDTDGVTVVFDGLRARINRDILPGEAIEQDVRIDMDNDILNSDKNYKVIITLVQEGMFWFDDIDQRFACEVDLRGKNAK